MSQNKQQPESDQETKQEGQGTKPVEGSTDDQSSLPLYLKDTSEGNRGNSEDEKDAMEE